LVDLFELKIICSQSGHLLLTANKSPN